jgi:hypothetical protein
MTDGRPRVAIEDERDARVAKNGYTGKKASVARGG